MEENKRVTLPDKAEEFKNVYEKYQNLIRRVAFDHLHDFYAAQDICQETFLRFYRYIEYMPKEKVKSWLIVVAANLAKDMLKKGGKYTEIVGLSEAKRTEEADLNESVIDEHITKMEAKILCSTALSSLRDKNQMWYEVLILVECMEVPRKKVAAEYNIAVTSVDGYLKRAKDWLKENFKEEYDNL